MPTQESQTAARRAYARTSVKGHRGISYRERANKSRRYYVSWKGRYVPEGGLSDLKTALAHQGRLRDAEQKGERIIVPAKVTFTEVAEQWWEDTNGEFRPNWAKDCRRALDKILIPEWGERRIGSLDPTDLITLGRKLRKQGLSESTAANYLKPARGVFDYAVLKRLIPSNPFRQVPRGSLPSSNQTREHREWASADVVKLIETAYALDKRDTARSDYGLSIELKLRSGARLGELLGIRYGDVDFAEGIWNVTSQWTKDGRVDVPKTKKSIRRIPLAPDLVKKIAARKLRQGAGEGDFVFATRNGLPPTQSNWRRRGWYVAVEKAGLTDGPKVTPHDARHAFASEMADLGLTSSDVGEVLGHTSAGVTERIYIGAFNRNAREDRIRAVMERAQNGS